MKNNFAAFLTLLSLSLFVLPLAAQPPRPPHAPPGGQRNWFERMDTNKNGAVERSEFDANVDSTFKNIDKNADDVIDENELPPAPHRGENGAPPPRRNGEELNAPERRNTPPPPPFLMKDINDDGELTRAEFDENARRHFTAMDKNSDAVVTREEANSFGNGLRPPPPPAPTIEFLGAEMRFGDKLVKNAAFSAQIVVENTRRLFDGTTIQAQNKGAIYRDAAGRTRREQILDTVGGFSLGAESQKLIFITDVAEGTQYFLDANRKTARRIPLSGNPLAINETDNSKTEPLGTKILEGVSVEGTRIVNEIPAGRIGNQKSLQIVTERWFSSELQTVVYSRHVDPLAGENVFRLTNIKRAEPARELFIVPSDYRIVNAPSAGRREDRKQ
jgi:hypothetical protein